MNRFLFAALLSLGLSATACGSNDPAGNGGGDAAPVPESDLAEKLATVKCDLLFSCGCAGSFSSKETCVNQTRAELQAVQKSAQDAELHYDASCAGKLLEKLTARGCAPITTCEPEVCWPYYGTTTFGGACEPSISSLTTTCAQGSTCANRDATGDKCGEPCAFDVKPEGTPCMNGQGHVTALCDAGLTCSQAAGGVCARSGKAGELCVDMHACESGNYCGGGTPDAPTCVAMLPNGAACNSPYQCLGRLCDAGKCADWPAICDPTDYPR